MENKKFGRREFLKITIATAAAAGLSHFRILNVGGTDVALAQDDCIYTGPGLPPDICDPDGGAGAPSPDTCPEPPNYTADGDICNEQVDPIDVCYPMDPGTPLGDLCDSGFDDPDVCIPDVEVDMCGAAQDECTDPSGGGPQVPDTCTDPGGNDPDDPNAVDVETFDAADGVEAASSTLPVLGGVIAALGAAALWVRSRLRRDG